VSAGSSNYRRGIRAATRGLWNAAFTYDQFYDAMMMVVRQGITAAWHEGAAECGIMPSELTPEEKTAMQQAMYSEYNHVNDFARTIEAGSKAHGGKMGTLMQRAELWINRYLDVTNRARVMACADQKLMWVLGPTKDHCIDCSRLNGKTKRASQWERAGIRPQSPALACGGWRCLCSLVVTDEPLSKGPLPRLAGPG